MEEDLFGEMVEAVGVGVGMYDSDGQYVYVNEAYANILSTDVETLLGMPIWEINDAVDPERFGRYWNSYDDGETKKAEAVHRFDGTEVDVQTITTRVSANGTTYNVGTIQDIGLRKQRERQLSQLHGVTTELIDAGSTGEIATLISETAESILDYERNVVRLLNESDELEPVARSESAAVDIGEPWSYSLDEDTPAVHCFEEGEMVIVEDATTIDDGHNRGSARSILYLPIGSDGILSVAHDEPDAFNETQLDLASILASNAETALRRLDSERDLQRQNERLEAFVDVISHDIPNHLTVANTRVDLAQELGELSHLEQVSAAHNRIESVITDMRSLVDHGEQIETTMWLRLSDLVTGCWENCREGPSQGQLELAQDGYIKADESRFKQLLENLFWNALEYAGPDPTIRVGLLADGFFIEDDGPGIPESNREQVLTPGFTSSDTDDHSGFGLAIVNEIARAHGWSISITDSSGGGARFEITGAAVELVDEMDSPQ